jgi:hypothetical protein
MRRFAAVGSVALLCLLVFGVPVQAQSAIAGVVRDTSGAFLPGVTVEASSPALIEGMRATATDHQGRYQIVDLRPGVYTVTFSLAGFATLRREGIELPTAFTATLNVELKVGAVEESVTVTGESPVVDTRSSVGQSVMPRQVLDALPTGRQVFSVAELIPGVTTGTPDVGGSEGMQQPTLQVHGSSTRDMVYQQDGMEIGGNFGSGNQTTFYYNEGAHEEISYQTSMLPAEVDLGGVRINMIPSQGGNEFHGIAIATGANSSMESDNSSEELKRRGLTARNSLDSVYDVNLSVGGPIRRDRLWFFGSVRHWAFSWFVANSFNQDGSQALDPNRITNGTVRLTYLANVKNRITLGYQRGWKYRWGRRTNQPATFVQPEAAMIQAPAINYIAQAKWTSTLSNKLLLEAGLSWLINHSATGYRPETKPTDVTKFDFTKSVLFNAPIYDQTSNTRVFSGIVTLSYVTGQHNFKAGVQLRGGPYWNTETKNGDILLRFDNGVANSVDLYNTPVNPRNSLDADHGVYAQDAWTMKRLTVNAGVRFDYFKSSIPAQTQPAGTWIGERSYPDIAVNTWKTVVPRLGVVYDVFGNGKTAVKLGSSKYVLGEGVSLAQTINPSFEQSQRCAWQDLNGDTEAQPNEISSCQGWTGGINTRIDPDLRRPYQWEFVAEVQHELMPRFSVSAGYYHRRYSQLYGIRNQLVPSTGYTPVTITNPLTNEPLTIYNQDPATRGRIDYLLTNQDALWTRYNGFELKAEKRFANGGTILGGFTAGRNRGSTLGSTSDLNNPNALVNTIGAVGYDSTYQLNLAGSWMLPLGVMVSGSLRTATGQPLTRSYTVTRTLVPTLTQVSQSVSLLPRGELRLQTNNLLDLRFAKIFRVRSTRLEAMADLYNVLNSNATTGEVTTVGPSLGRVSSILQARFLRLGVQMKF